MHLCAILYRDWKTTAKTVCNTICLLFLFFVSANNVWGRITIRAGSLLDWTPNSTNLNPELLPLDEYVVFTATAFQTNPHDFQLAPSIEKDPEFGYIEFSATGSPENPFFSNPMKECDLICMITKSLTHSIKYKWDMLGPQTVTARVYDEAGNLHDSVEWHVQIGELTFNLLPDPSSNPSIPASPTLQIYPDATEGPGYYTKRVRSETTFRVQATSEDGIASIAFSLEDSSGFRRLIDEKADFIFPKRVIAYWPSFEVEQTWQTLGNYRVIAQVTTIDGGFREVIWQISVIRPNAPPIPLNPGSLTDLGSLTAGGASVMVDVSEHFRDPEGEPLVFDEVGIDASTPNIVTLNVLEDSDGYKSIISIEPENPGRALFYAITRERDGLPAMQSFTVLVAPEVAYVPAQQKPEEELSPEDMSVPVEETTKERPVSSPDLIIDTIHIDKTTLDPGERFQVETLVWNQGRATSSATTLRYYLSADEKISSENTEIANYRVNPLSGRGAHPSRRRAELSETLTVPETPGVYYYGVCIDAVAGETDTSNNCSQTIAITVGTPPRDPEDTPIVPPPTPEDTDVPVEETTIERPLTSEDTDVPVEETTIVHPVSSPDLIIDAIHIDKTTLDPGERFQMETVVWNQGRVTSSRTTLRYYLSVDEKISPEDMEVASDRVAALLGRGAHPIRRRARLSETLTAPETPGVHYYGVCIGTVAGEADTSSNCSQAIAITVEMPPRDPEESQDPVLLPRPEEPDLVISWARVDAPTIKLGGGVRLHITLENRGKSAAPATTIRYYRSLDATISPEEDTELRAVPVGGLGPGKSYTTWALLPGATSLGVYYYGACLDGVESEFDTTNNCSSTFEITIEAQGTGEPTLVPVGTIRGYALGVRILPVVLDVSGYFLGKVERYTASSSETSVVTVSMSGTEVALTPVGEGYATVTILASSGDLAAKQTFSVSVGGTATPEHILPDPDLSPEVSIQDANLRAAVRSTLGLAKAIPLPNRKCKH